MNIEIVWLAYDSNKVDEAWGKMTVRELHSCLINDNFRKKVDPRSMLFHNKQSNLLNDVETLMMRGAINLKIEEYLSLLFYQGEEEFPIKPGELFFDYSLISYFTSLRMADDYHKVENFFDKLWKKMKIMPESGQFSFFELKDLDKFAENLREVKVQDILEVVESNPSFENQSEPYTRLVQNYIEFFNYYKNNHLTPFFYNSETDIKKWGDLVERQNERSLRIVNLAYKKVKQVLDGAMKAKRKGEVDESKLGLISRFKNRRRLENLIAGLSDSDPLIRQKACEYLGTFGRTEDLPYLLKALNDSEAEVRQEASRALGEIGNKSAVDPLIERVLSDDSPQVVTSSAQALSNIGEKRGALALIERLKKGIYQVAVPIAFFPLLSENKEAMDALLLAFDDKNPELRRQIAFILGSLKTQDSVRRLASHLNDEDKEVKINTICSLGRIGTKDAIDPLKEILDKSGDEEIKRYSKMALGAQAS